MGFTFALRTKQQAEMKNIPTYNNVNELIDTLKQMKRTGWLEEEGTTIFHIQPVCVVGRGKTGFVNWQNCKIECSPICDDRDRLFVFYQDCISSAKATSGVCQMPF